MGFVRIVVVLLVIACVPLLSNAAEVHLTNSTQYLWYQNILGSNDKEGDVADYLRLNATKLDKNGKINIYGYGRVTKQVTSDEDVKARLYYLYLDYRDVLKDHLDLRVGRTYVNSAAISGNIDGAFVDLKKLGPVGVTLFGGRNVIFANKSEVGSGNTLLGTSVYFDTVKNTHVEVSYGQKSTDSHVARENVGLDFSTTPHRMVNLYGRMQYDTVSDEFNDMLFGAKLVPITDLSLRAEYYQTHPTFDKRSIYRVFEVNKYKEISFDAEYRLTPNYRINGRYAREDFGDSANANLYQAGFLARPISDLTLNASYEQRTGYAGALSGIRFNGEYRFWKAAVLAGVDFDDFKRGEDSRDDNAKKYWAGLNYTHNKTFSAAVRVENNENYNYDHNYQGFTTLNINF